MSTVRLQDAPSVTSHFARRATSPASLHFAAEER